MNLADFSNQSTENLNYFFVNQPGVCRAHRLFSQRDGENSKPRPLGNHFFEKNSDRHGNRSNAWFWGRFGLIIIARI